MAWVKLYERIGWENVPSIKSPINDLNLNKIDIAVDGLDDRVIELQTTKAEQTDLLDCVESITYNTVTGVFVFTWQDGHTLTVDLNIEKIPVSFTMSAQGVITMTNADGTSYTADVGELIKTYTFNDSARIACTVTTDANGNKVITPDLIKGSITGDYLQPNYLADITAQASLAGASATAAATSEANAAQSAQTASTKATEASQSATTASTKADEASASATTASNKATEATTAAQTATTKASEASTSAQTATAKATEAATSASNASTSETNAQNSATTATTKATEASASADRAEQAAQATEGVVKWSERKGYVGKNLLENKATSQTINGVTFTVNDDKSITVNGTATANVTYRLVSNGETALYLDSVSYTLSVGVAVPQGTYFTMVAPQGTNRDISGGWSRVTFAPTANTLVYEVRYWIPSGTVISNLTLYPMLRYASITDDTYEPYIPPNDKIAEKAFSDVSWDEQNVLGAKNLFNARSFTRDTLTVTKESDGGYLISGTTTIAARFIPDVTFINSDMSPIKKGRYKFIAVDASGNSVFGTRFAYQALGRNSTDDAWVEFSKNGNVFTVPDDYAITWVRLNMAIDIAYDTKVYIMVMPATIENETYAPYAMTNRELTEKVQRKTVYANNATVTSDALSTIAFSQQIVDATSIRYFTASCSGVIVKIDCELEFSSDFTITSYSAGVLISGLESILPPDGILRNIPGYVLGEQKPLILNNRNGVLQIETCETLTLASGNRLIFSFVTIGK